MPKDGLARTQEGVQRGADPDEEGREMSIHRGRLVTDQRARHSVIYYELYHMYRNYCNLKLTDSQDWPSIDNLKMHMFN